MVAMAVVEGGSRGSVGAEGATAAAVGSSAEEGSMVPKGSIVAHYEPVVRSGSRCETVGRDYRIQAGEEYDWTAGVVEVGVP